MRLHHYFYYRTCMRSAVVYSLGETYSRSATLRLT